jgi:phosphoglycerate dehydrogenase-like enzyme
LADEADLLDALRSKHLAGTGRDVLAAEATPAGHLLLALDNVIASPHVSAK